MTISHGRFEKSQGTVVWMPKRVMKYRPTERAIWYPKFWKPATGHHAVDTQRMSAQPYL